MNSDVTFGFTDKQAEAFKELKNQILCSYGAQEAGDYQIYRFLKARNFSVQHARDMLTKHIHWKKDLGVETILKDFTMPEVLKKYAHLSRIGYDIEGHVTFYLNVGAVDFKGLLKSEKNSNCLKYVVYFLTGCEKSFKEQSEKSGGGLLLVPPDVCLKETLTRILHTSLMGCRSGLKTGQTKSQFGKPIETWNVIFDMENLSFMQAMHKPTIEFIMSALSLHEANYPERLKTAYIINVSMPFYVIYNAIKYLLAASTIRKVQFFGKDGWKEALLRIMDPDELPAFLGGNKTDSDGNELCLTTVNHGGPIPEYYYFRSSKRRLSLQHDIKTYTLGRKGKVDILLEVKEPGSTIEWEFETESNDIAFGLFFQGKIDSKMKPIQLIATQRANTYKEIETGIYKCTKTGIYILTLDNSYSWFRQKTIFCRTSVNPPPEKEENDY